MALLVSGGGELGFFSDTLCIINIQLSGVQLWNTTAVQTKDPCKINRTDHCAPVCTTAFTKKVLKGISRQNSKTLIQGASINGKKQCLSVFHCCIWFVEKRPNWLTTLIMLLVLCCHWRSTVVLPPLSTGIEPKQHAVEIMGVHSPPPFQLKKLKVQLSVGKLLISFNERDPWLIEFPTWSLHHQCDAHCDTSQHLKKAVTNKWPATLSKGAVLLPDKAPSHHYVHHQTSPGKLLLGGAATHFPHILNFFLSVP